MVSRQGFHPGSMDGVAWRVLPCLRSYMEAPDSSPPLAMMFGTPGCARMPFKATLLVDPRTGLQDMVRVKTTQKS